MKKTTIITMSIIILFIIFLTSCNSSNNKDNNQNIQTQNNNEQNVNNQNEEDNNTSNQNTKEINNNNATILDIEDTDALYDFVNENVTKVDIDRFKNWNIQYADITKDGNKEAILMDSYDSNWHDKLIIISAKENSYEMIPTEIYLAKYNNEISYQDDFLILKQQTGGTGVQDTTLSLYIYNGDKIVNVLSHLKYSYSLSTPDTYIEQNASIEGDYTDFIYTLTFTDMNNDKTYTESKIHYKYNKDDNSFIATPLIRKIPNLDDLKKIELFNLKNSIVFGGWELETTQWCTVETALANKDINNDGIEDKIEAGFYYDKDSFLQVNDLSSKVFTENTGGIYLVDLDENDDYIEIAIMDHGPSGDPSTTFFRYTGDDLINMGYVNANIYSPDDAVMLNGNILTDGKGLIISPSDIIRFVNPYIYKGFSIIRDNVLINRNIDPNFQINNAFVFSKDFSAFFKETSDLSTIELNFSLENERLFKKNTKIKILEINDYWHYVELEDETKGILFFYLGD